MATKTNSRKKSPRNGKRNGKRKPATKPAVASTPLSALPKAKRSQFCLDHETNSYNKIGKQMTALIQKRHFAAEFCNAVGVGNSTTLANVLEYARSQSGGNDSVVRQVERWIREQAGVDVAGWGNGKSKIANPKLSLDKSGKITVLKYHVSRGAGRITGSIAAAAAVAKSRAKAATKK